MLSQKDANQLVSDSSGPTHISEEHIDGNQHVPEDRALRQKLIIIGLAGAAFQAVSQAFLPAQHAWLFDSEPRSGWIGFAKQLYTLFATFPVQLVCIGIFAFLAVYRWRSPRAVIYAFFAGWGAVYAVLHWLTPG